MTKAFVAESKKLAIDGDIFIMESVDVIGQAIELGLADEVRLPIAPIIAGDGTPHFKPGTGHRYRLRGLRASRNAAHVTYERLSD